ncbi:Zn(2)-C6 fungal-type domain-containing protein [Fusarium sp. Ph1]|nr:Zn(2)-C6 fungal-type domain-containing protein [Fusarium sp. Ph1]
MDFPVASAPELQSACIEVDYHRFTNLDSEDVLSTEHQDCSSQDATTINTLSRYRDHPPHSIAASLIPLPSELSQSPLDRFLWSYFVERGSQMFQCWEPTTTGPLGTSENPYKTILASMAAYSVPLRLAVLGLSAFLYSKHSERPVFAARASKLVQQSSEALCVSRLGDNGKPQSLIETIATATLLTLLDTQTETNLLALARSAAAFMAESQAQGQPDANYEVVLHLLRWSYICTHCSPTSIDLPASLGDHVIEFHGGELETDFSKQFGSWVIHPLYTFSHRLINPLLEIGRLIRERKRHKAALGLGSEDAWDQQASKLEKDLLTAREIDLAAWEKGVWEHADLVNLSEAIYSAAFLLYYTRVRDLPWTTQIVRRHVNNICERLSNIDRHSRTLNNVVFPLYTAGCEAVDMSARERLESLMGRLHSTGYWFNQHSKLIGSLHHVWEIRDNDPGAPWLEWSEKVTGSIVNCIPV